MHLFADPCITPFTSYLRETKGNDVTKAWTVCKTSCIQAVFLVNTLLTYILKIEPINKNIFRGLAGCGNYSSSNSL